MVVNDARHFGSKVCLRHIQNVVIDEGDFSDLLRLVNTSKCIPEEEIGLRNFAVLKMHRDLEIAVEVCGVCIDDWHE